jgi:hypothetical protein
MRKLLSSLLAVLILSCLAISAFATSPSVTFQSKEDGFSFTPGSRYSPTDLFPGFKDVLPGDHLEESIPLKNAHSSKVRLFLDFWGGEEDLNFLRQLHLKVYHGDTLLFSASPDQPGETASLGVFSPGETKELRVSLDVPLSLSNEFAACRGDVVWVFSAEEVPGGNLIQTGQVIWPVYLFAFLGFVFLILGSIFLLKKRHE